MSARLRNLFVVVVLLASVTQAQERVYWTSDDGSVRRTTVGVPGVDVLVSGQLAPRGIKVDRCTDRMFWVDSEAQKRHWSDTNGSNVQQVTTSGNPYELAIDPVEQIAFWYESLGGPGLRRANYYSAGGPQISSDWENGALYGHVTVNIVEGKIYGCGIDCAQGSPCTGYIWKTTLHGGGMETVLTLEVNSYPAYIVVDPFAEKMYWSEWTTHRIRRANLDGTELETLTTTNVASRLALDLAAEKIYWTDVVISEHKIMRANLDLSGAEAVVQNQASAITGLDVEGGALDLNSNGIDDGCEMALPPALFPEAEGVAKPRFISLRVPGGRDTALRVRLVSLHNVVPPYTGGPSIPFSAFEGEIRWVGPGLYYPESTGSELQYYVGRLTCEPQYRDWNSTGVLHINDSGIVPSSIYEIENLSSECMGIESTCTSVSAPLVLTTARWGDVQVPYSAAGSTVQPDVSDISAIVDKFKNRPGALTKTHVLLAGFSGDPYGQMGGIELSFDVNFSQVSAGVDAFRGVPYPYTIEDCP